MAIEAAQVSKIYVGSQEIEKVYVGSNLVFGQAAAENAPSFVALTKEVYHFWSWSVPREFNVNITSGNKLVVFAGTQNRVDGAVTPTITYNSAEPDALYNYRYSTTTGSPFLSVAVFDSPASGDNDLSVAWSANVKHSIIYAIEVTDVGAVLATKETARGTWTNQTGVSVSIPEENAVVLHAAIGHDTTTLSIPWTAEGMTRESEDESAENDSAGLIGGVAWEVNPPMGTRAISSYFTQLTGGERTVACAIVLAGTV